MGIFTSDEPGPSVTRKQFVAALRDLGLDVTNVYSIEFDIKGITLNRYAINALGQKIVDATGEMATVYVRIEFTPDDLRSNNCTIYPGQHGTHDWIGPVSGQTYRCDGNNGAVLNRGANR